MPQRCGNVAWSSQVGQRPTLGCSNRSSSCCGGISDTTTYNSEFSRHNIICCCVSSRDENDRLVLPINDIEYPNCEAHLEGTCDAFDAPIPLLIGGKRRLSRFPAESVAAARFPPPPQQSSSETRRCAPSSLKQAASRQVELASRDGRGGERGMSRLLPFLHGISAKFCSVDIDRHFVVQLKRNNAWSL